MGAVGSVCEASASAAAAASIATEAVESGATAATELASQLNGNNDTFLAQLPNTSSLALGGAEGTDFQTAASTAASQSSDTFSRLCNCSALAVPRPCVADWVEDQWEYALAFMAAVFAFEGLCSMFAWALVDDIKESTMIKLDIAKRRSPDSGAAGWHLPQSLTDAVSAGETVAAAARDEVRAAYLPAFTQALRTAWCVNSLHRAGSSSHFDLVLRRRRAFRMPGDMPSISYAEQNSAPTW